MEYRRLGRSGLQVSALSLGSWLTFGLQIGDDVAEELMTVAYENGVNFSIMLKLTLEANRR